MTKSIKFTFIILLILLTHAEGKGGRGGGGRGGSSSRGGGYRGSSSYGGGGGGESWPWYVKALIVIFVVIVVLICVCACIKHLNEDEDDKNREMTTRRPPERHLDPIKTQPFDPIKNQRQESSAHRNSGDPGALPYPVQPQPAGESSLANPPQAQGWINPQGSNGQQTDGVPCNPTPYPPAYDPHGSNNDTPSIPPPAYEASDSP